jgi:hypothetical protein
MNTKQHINTIYQFTTNPPSQSARNPLGFHLWICPVLWHISYCVKRTYQSGARCGPPPQTCCQGQSCNTRSQLGVSGGINGFQIQSKEKLKKRKKQEKSMLKITYRQ